MKFKTFAILFGLFFMLIVLILFIETKISDGHRVAVDAIGKSDAVQKNIGHPDYIILTGASSKLHPNAISCYSLSYFVVGDSGFESIDVELKKVDFFKGKWEVLEIVQGYFNSGEFSC